MSFSVIQRRQTWFRASKTDELEVNVQRRSVKKVFLMQGYIVKLFFQCIS